MSVVELAEQRERLKIHCAELGERAKTAYEDRRLQHLDYKLAALRKLESDILGGNGEADLQRVYDLRAALFFDSGASGTPPRKDKAGTSAEFLAKLEEAQRAFQTLTRSSRVREVFSRAMIKERFELDRGPESKLASEIAEPLAAQLALNEVLLYRPLSSSRPPGISLMVNTKAGIPAMVSDAFTVGEDLFRLPTALIWLPVWRGFEDAVSIVGTSEAEIETVAVLCRGAAYPTLQSALKGAQALSA